MKLISLNTWGGRGGKENLLNFIEYHKGVDVFCFQEMWNGGEHMAGKITGGSVLENISYKLLAEIGEILTEYEVYFRPHYGDWYGLAMFVKKDHTIKGEGEIFVHKERGWADKKDEGNHARNIQWVTIETKLGLRTIINFHGLWNGQGKGDSEDRLIQSDNILNFIKNIPDPHILCGDFNLRPDTQSIKKLEQFGLKNLIKEHNITSTRTDLYTKPEKFADYMFVTPDIKVKSFEVPNVPISDHRPLILEFE